VANVCVIGLGQIGLPLALVLAKANHTVFGVDASIKRLEKIHNYLNEKNFKDETPLLKKFLNKRFFISDNLYESLSKSEVVFIAIGTGVSPGGAPDLSNIFGLINQICANPSYVKGKLFVIKSTLPLGTVRKIGSQIEKATGLSCRGDDFQLAFCPERVLGDRAVFEMESLPKVIGGINKLSTDRAIKIYRTIGGKLVVMNSPEEAEFIKLIDNSYRQTLFGFANDLALLADHLGFNAVNIIRAANDSYPRNNIPLPSPGVSGFCLTKDPLYLETAFEQVAKKRGFSSVWYYARKTNDYMPVHVANVLCHYFERLSLPLDNSNILVCGICYKEDVDDIRFSHGLEIASLLKRNGANIYIWDPISSAENLGFTKVQNPYEISKNLDALIFTVKHKEFVKLTYENRIIDLLKTMRHPVIIDGWGLFQNLIKKQDIQYAGIGIFNDNGQIPC
jgi:nucleotide sugar dehydrogenase